MSSTFFKSLVLCVFLTLFKIEAASAQFGVCPEPVNTVSTCPSGCHVNTKGVLNQDVINRPCYANQGGELACPPPFAGETVFTATQNGVCVSLINGCESGQIRAGKQLIHEGRFAKVYAPDCNGTMTVLVAKQEDKKSDRKSSSVLSFGIRSTGQR